VQTGAGAEGKGRVEGKEKGGGFDREGGAEESDGKETVKVLAVQVQR
jgi:hypothetical protein